MPVERRRIVETLKIGPVVTIEPEKLFPCSSSVLRRLLFMAGPDRELAAVDIRHCLEELERIHPENAKQYQENIDMLEEIE